MLKALVYYILRAGEHKNEEIAHTNSVIVYHSLVFCEERKEIEVPNIDITFYC